MNETDRVTNMGRFHRKLCRIGMALSFGLTAASALAVECPAVEKEAESKRVLIPASQAIWITLDRGKVQIYSAPDKRCPKKGLFIGPGRKVSASMDYNGFIRVREMDNPDGADVDGWVLEDRLMPTGTGVGPN